MLILYCFHKEFPLVGSYIRTIQVLILDQGGMMQQFDWV